jgi:hypothetical protein
VGGRTAWAENLKSYLYFQATPTPCRPAAARSG